MKHTYRPAPTQYESYTFSALANAELENLIRIIREEGYPADPKDRWETGTCGSAGYGREGLYSSPEHMDVLHQAEVKLRERTRGTL